MSQRAINRCRLSIIFIWCFVTRSLFLNKDLRIYNPCSFRENKSIPNLLTRSPLCSNGQPHQWMGAGACIAKRTVGMFLQVWIEIISHENTRELILITVGRIYRSQWKTNIILLANDSFASENSRHSLKNHFWAVLTMSTFKRSTNVICSECSPILWTPHQRPGLLWLSAVLVISKNSTKPAKR